MVSISMETPSQTERRLLKVLADSDLVWESGEYSYVEYPVTAFPQHAAETALAFVRDRDTWSVLKPATAACIERFALFSCHFPANADNSGFVGWLATIIKRSLGSGVVVICGYNRDRGGVYDYWGVPWSLRDEVELLLDTLRRQPIGV